MNGLLVSLLQKWVCYEWMFARPIFVPRTSHSLSSSTMDKKQTLLPDTNPLMLDFPVFRTEKNSCVL